MATTVATVRMARFVSFKQDRSFIRKLFYTK